MKNSEPRSLRFWIPGPPVPKGRPRLGRGIIYTPAKTKAYEATVAAFAKLAGASPSSGPVAVGIYINASGKWDLDNCIKSILDGLNGVAYHDDSQVRLIFATRSGQGGKDEGTYVVVHYIGRTK